MIEFLLNGKEISAAEGTTVAAAVLSSGETGFRRSVNGEPRMPLCGMGICYECRLTINGVMYEKSCQILVTEGMSIETDGKN